MVQGKIPLPLITHMYIRSSSELVRSIWRVISFMIPASAIIVALYIAINLDSMSVGSDGTEILKFSVKYTRQGLSHYYTPCNAMAPLLRMIARFSGDFLPNNVIHGLFFMFSWKW